MQRNWDSCSGWGYEIVEISLAVPRTVKHSADHADQWLSNFPPSCTLKRNGNMPTQELTRGIVYRGILMSAEGWKMDRICCSHTVTLSVTEVKDALIHDTLCEILKNTVLSEKSQTPKLIVCPFSAAVTECMSSSPVKGAEMLPLTIPEAGMFSAKHQHLEGPSHYINTWSQKPDSSTVAVHESRAHVLSIMSCRLL